MSIISAIIASTVSLPIGVDPGGATSSFYNSQMGLIQKNYLGYFGDDVNWFSLQTPTSTSVATSIYNFSVDPADNISVQWTGYFYCNNSGLYNFRTTSDDASFMWIGVEAVSGYSIENAAVKNGGLHGQTTVVSEFSYILTNGLYYPIRIQYGESSGGSLMMVEFNRNGGYFSTIGNIYSNSESFEGF